MAQAVVPADRPPRTMSYLELSRKHHCDGISREDAGTIAVMRHTVAVRYSGQRRKSGAWATSHFFCVEDILADLDFGLNCELIGLGHDFIEDGVMSLDEILDSFGERVAAGVLVLSKRPEHAKNDPARFDQVLEAVTNGLWEAGVVKLADRAHNLRTLYGFRDLEKEAEYLAKTADNALRLADLSWGWIELYAKEHLAAYAALCAMLHKEYDVQVRRVDRERKRMRKNV